MMSTLDRFQLLEEVGRGGMGTVYRALDPVINRPVAIKVFETAGARERLLREARSAGQLSHPGIVTIYQAGEEGDCAYIAMEFVDGSTLRTLMNFSRNTGKERLCQVLLEVGAALDYAHGRGLVHRDIKPENIIVTTAGVAKVTDFGIAKTMQNATHTQAGMLAGTPLYMSPEQIRGRPVDGRSDQFALATIAYEMFVGRTPFVAEEITAICYQITHEAPQFPASVSAPVAAVLRRGLAKEPAHRFESCVAFTEALRTAALRQTETVRRDPSSRRSVAFAAGSFIVAAMLLSAAAFTPIPETKPKSLPENEMLRVPAKGRLTWEGSARPGDLIEITRAAASSGLLSGRLPGVPVSVKLYPAERTVRGLRIFSSSPEETGLDYDPRRSTDLTLFETPTEQNHWERLMVVANSNISAFVVEWRTE